MALFTFGRIDFRDRHVVALRARPSGNSVPPPKLPRDAPVLNDRHPVQVSFRPRFGFKGDRTIFHDVPSCRRHLRHPRKPLLAQERLNKAEKRIDELLGVDEHGTPKTRPFDPHADSSAGDQGRE